MASTLESHDLVPEPAFEGIRYEKRPCRGTDGHPVGGLFHAWITLDNPSKMNAYTTEMVRSLVLAFQRASNERDVVAVVLTGAGDKAFSTGGDARHYAEAYASRPDEFRQYLKLFSDAITAILRCDKPVICRVNGMRIAGGQELGMACDVSVASDLAVFGQAGARHGSAPVMGSTAFLPLFVGIEWAVISCTLSGTWTAYEAVRLRLVSEAVPVLRVDGRLVPNPLVVTDRWLDERGAFVHGRPKEGAALAEGKALLARGTIDLSPLDEAIERLGTMFLMTMPGCLTKTLEALRRHKTEAWERHKEGDRLWLAQNMMTEARAGFRAFTEGPRDDRQVDFVALRRLLAKGAPWDDALIDAVMPRGGPAAGRTP